MLDGRKLKLLFRECCCCSCVSNVQWCCTGLVGRWETAGARVMGGGSERGREVPAVW